MQLVEIDIIGAEAAQRRLDGRQQMLARGALVPGRWTDLADGLGREDELLAAPLQPAPDDILRATGKLGAAAQRIDIGRVDEIDPGLGRLVQNAPRYVFFSL